MFSAKLRCKSAKRNTEFLRILSVRTVRTWGRKEEKRKKHSKHEYSTHYYTIVSSCILQYVVRSITCAVAKLSPSSVKKGLARWVTV